MSLSPVTVGTFTRSLLLHVAQLSGKFDAAGLEVDEVSVTSSPAQFDSLQSGEYDLILTGPDNVIAYRFVPSNPLGRIIPVEIVAGIDRGLGLSLCLSPDTGSAIAARDRIVGVDVARSGFAFIAYALLEQAGLEPGSYRVEALGSTPRRADALIAGECQATILNAGNELRAMRAGCSLVSRVTECGPYLGTVLAALPSRDEAAARSRRAFAGVLRETTGEILAGRWEAELVEAAMELLGLGEQDAEEHYGVLVSAEHGYVADGIVDRESLMTALSLRKRYLPAPELDGIPALFESFVASDVLDDPSA